MLMKTNSDGHGNGDDGTYDEVDMAAFKLAIEMYRARDEKGAQQIDDFLNGYCNDEGDIIEGPRPWVEVAKFCSYSMQMNNLGMHSALCPPCWAHSGRPGPKGTAFREIPASRQADVEAHAETWCFPISSRPPRRNSRGAEAPGTRRLRYLRVFLFCPMLQRYRR